MKVAVVGCIHGELDVVYQEIQRIETQEDIKVDLLLICGDFQALRNENDFKCIAIPKKYHQLGTFNKYYFGLEKAPVLTLFIGGNHEASNYLMTLPYGGWVAPNIYYMGYSSIVNFGGLRIAGISGIYHSNDVNRGHFERLPFDEDTKRSIYHTRYLEAYRFMSVQEDIDIFLSHDWPLNIYFCGNINELLRRKPFFRNDIDKKKLGNPLLEPILKRLKPRYWFSAHLHVKFHATVRHNQKHETKFLALDKCLPRREYLKILDIQPKEGAKISGLEYDREWLSILKATDEYLSVNPCSEKSAPQLWTPPRLKPSEMLKQIDETFGTYLTISNDFQLVEPVLKDLDTDPERCKNITNPITSHFCSKLNITDPIQKIINLLDFQANPDEIKLSDDDETDDDNDENEEKRESESEPKKLKTEVSDNNDNCLFFIDKKGLT